MRKGDDTDSSFMYCPSCGNVYNLKGNNFNQLQPDWERVSRIISRRALAKHISLCDEKIAPELAMDFIESLNVSEKESQFLKNYAKAGCLMKINKGL